jgi:hypothetical protein
MQRKEKIELMAMLFSYLVEGLITDETLMFLAEWYGVELDVQ